MKKVIITIATLLTISMNAQINNPVATPNLSKNDSLLFIKPRSAGDEFQRFTTHMYEGLVISAVGGALIVTSTQVQHNDFAGKELLMGFGGAVMLGGTALMIESFIHIKRAGIILNENGVGIKINITK